MSIPIIDACRKRKRKPNIYSFSNFSDPGYPISFTSDAFRDNVRLFLRQCATLEDHKVDGMSVSCTLLMHEGKNAVVPLYTIEENVKSSLNTFCDHCRCAGWSKNFLSKRRYHFVIPADENWNKPLDDGVMDDQTCLLHGLIHCNGYGHLICVNGAEGGSQFLFGKEIMDLWDRICTNLQTRKVTVEDVSKKRSMDLRLLHGVAYGHPWFGRWGYTFCRRSFGVSESNYVRAIDVLSSIKLDSIVQDFGRGNGSKEIKKLVQSYRDLSETRVITVRDLLRTMLNLKSRLAPQKKLITADTSSASSSSWRASTRNSSQQHKQFAKEKPVECRKFTNVAAHMDSRWPVKRLEYTAQIIIDTLKEKKLDRSSSHSGMTRQEVRDAARMHIGDTGLLDYVLKAMNNVMIGGYIVRRVVNPNTRILEYSLHEHNGVVNVDEPEPEVASDKHSLSITNTRHGSDVYDDIVYLYTTVLLAYPDSKLIELAIQPGTYLYHAHCGMQREVGLYGAIRVSLPDGVLEPYAYDYDRSIILNDWYHKDPAEQALGLSSIPFVWVGEPQSLLIQGRGRFNCTKLTGTTSDVCNATLPECSPYVMTVNPGKTYRLRISSLTSLSALSFQFEGHNMTVVEADGHNVEPFVVQNLFIYSGETYSVLIKADQVPTRNYWASVTIVTRNATTPPGVALLNYYPNHPRRYPTSIPLAGPPSLQGVPI